MCGMKRLVNDDERDLLLADMGDHPIPPMRGLFSSIFFFLIFFCRGKDDARLAVPHICTVLKTRKGKKGALDGWSAYGE